VPLATVNLSPQSAGKLVALYVEQGDQVKAGQILARMDSSLLQAELTHSKAQLMEALASYEQIKTGNRVEEISRAQAEVAAAQVKADLSATRAQRYQYLYQEGGISQDQQEEAASQAESDRANLQVAQQSLQQITSGSRPEEIQQAAAKVASAEAMVEQTQAQLEETVIRAPFDGIITQKYATVGSIVTPTTSASSSASATSTSIVALATGLEARINVPEASIASLLFGQLVEIKTDAYSDQTFQGQVRLIAPEAVVESNVTSFQVRVELLSGQDKLRSGMNVDAAFLGDTLENAVMVPLVAITSQEDQMGVMLADAQGQPRFQPVTLGITQGNQAQILEGVQPGERVFIDSPAQLSTGLFP
jgi:HlyD family secretion protein